MCVSVCVRAYTQRCCSLLSPVVSLTESVSRVGLLPLTLTLLLLLQPGFIPAERIPSRVDRQQKREREREREKDKELVREEAQVDFLLTTQTSPHSSGRGATEETRKGQKERKSGTRQV